MLLSSCMDSSSAKTEENVYSVSLKATKVVISSEIFLSDLGDFNRSNAAVASAARCKASARCDSADAACFLADTMSFANESASWRASWASDSALLAAALAVADSSLALRALSIAESASVMARSDFLLAASAFSSSDPISFPEIWFVFTKHISSKARDAISTNVENLASLSFFSLIPPVNQLVKSAANSPAQAIATKPQEIYSPSSQWDIVFVRE